MVTILYSAIVIFILPLLPLHRNEHTCPNQFIMRIKLILEFLPRYISTYPVSKATAGH